MEKLILLHGALGTDYDLTPLSREFETKEIEPYCFCFSGHGKNPFADEFGINQFARELKAFIQFNKLVKPSVFGYSMGGYVALKLASENQDLLGKIITLGTKFDWDRKTVDREASMCDSEFILEKAPELAKRLQKNHHDWIKLLSKTKEMIINFEINKLLDNTALNNIKSPVMLGLGDKDKMVSMQETTDAKNSITNSSFFVLPSTKHPFENVRVKLLAELILDFLPLK